MKQFIACICDDDLSQLVVSGVPTAEQLAEAWAQLFLEYCDLAEHTEVKYKALLQQDIAIMEAQIETANSCVTCIRACIEHGLPIRPGFITALEQSGFENDYDLEDTEALLKSLKRVDAQVIPIKIRLKAKRQEYEVLMENSTQTDKVDRKYFHTIFLRLNTYFKHEAVNMQSTVQQYCAALRDYVAAAKESIFKA